MPETMYKKGARRKENKLKSKNTPATPYTLQEVEKRINDRIEWCKKSYGESKMNVLIDMNHHNNRRKALSRLRSQHNILSSYMSLLSNESMHVFVQNDSDTFGDIVIGTIGENPNILSSECYKIHIHANLFNVTSDVLPLTSENIRYIKRIVYLSALGQIS